MGTLKSTSMVLAKAASALMRSAGSIDRASASILERCCGPNKSKKNTLWLYDERLEIVASSSENVSFYIVFDYIEI